MTRFPWWGRICLWGLWSKVQGITRHKEETKKEPNVERHKLHSGLWPYQSRVRVKSPKRQRCLVPRLLNEDKRWKLSSKWDLIQGKWSEIGSVERVNHSLNDCDWGYLCLQEYQMLRDSGKRLRWPKLKVTYWCCWLEYLGSVSQEVNLWQVSWR